MPACSPIGILQATLHYFQTLPPVLPFSLPRSPPLAKGVFLLLFSSTPFAKLGLVGLFSAACSVLFALLW